MKAVSNRSAGAAAVNAAALGCVMFGGYAGPGFAAGTQTVQYFLTRGKIGVFIGPLIVAVLTFIAAYINFEISRRWRPDSYIANSNILWRSKTLRRILAILRDLVFLFAVIVGMAAMNSMLCGILRELYGVPAILTTVLFVVLAVLLSVRGRKMLTAAGTVLTVAIIAVLLYVGIPGIAKALPQAREWMAQGLTFADFGFSPVTGFYSMIALTATCLAAANPIVPAASESIGSRGESLIGAAVHAVLSFAATVIFTVIFAGLMPEAASQDLPTLSAMKGLLGTSPVITHIFALLMIACVLSTAVAYMYGISERWALVLHKVSPKHSLSWWKFVLALIFALISMAGSRIGLVKLMQYGFTYISMISFPIFVLPMYFLYPYRVKGDKRRGWLNEKGEWKEDGDPQEKQYAYGP